MDESEMPNLDALRKLTEKATKRAQERERQRLLDERFSENHQRCFHCNAYTDLCECDGGIP